MDIIIIAAMSENRVIGKDNALPWSLKEDMSRFRELTRGWPCVMGRKTWESLPKRPLPGRPNIVISRSLPSIRTEPFTSVFGWHYADTAIEDYDPHPAIKFDIAV